MKNRNVKSKAVNRKKRGDLLYERLKSVIGAARGMPPDASVNVDHYLYGAPKQKVTRGKQM